MKKFKMPYRIGTTSYIYPEEILFNVEKLKERVDDIELLFFDAESFPSKKLMDKLKLLSLRYDFSYTVHLPLELKLADADLKVRASSVDKITRFIERTAYLESYAYILHIDSISGMLRNPDLIALWRKNARESVEDILKNVSVRPSLICVENLDYPLDLLDDIIEDFKLSVCLDIGHMAQYGYDILKYCRKYIRKTRVIHISGINASGIHSSLKNMDEKNIKKLKKYLADIQYKGLLTLEIFSETDLKESLEIMCGRNGGEI